VDVAYLATQGTGSNDEARIAALLAPLGARAIAFDRSRKAGAAVAVLRSLLREPPDVLVLEGTGIAGGLTCLLARTLKGVPYVVSSGDAVAPYLRMLRAWLGPFGAVYERLLYRRSAGFIGWSPYLAGRALALGAPRAMTAANWAELVVAPGDRERVRERLGIAPDALVFGLVGSLNWSARRGYCYGLELVRAAVRSGRDDLVVLVVGDGDGRARLAAEAGAHLGERVLLPGAVPRDEVGAHLAAMDVASLPQSLDGVGSFRFTTKLSEYLAAGVPVVTGQLPLAYDLDDGWLWRVPGRAPWDDTYVEALAALMRQVQGEEVAAKRAAVPAELPLFDRERQSRQVSDFVRDSSSGLY
jgi:glycosyltransferase involved in cell wall biosynthesis